MVSLHQHIHDLQHESHNIHDDIERIRHSKDHENENHNESRRGRKRSLYLPLMLFCCVLLFVLGLPSTNKNVGYLWTYPLYESTCLRTLYVMGTWVWLYLFLHWSYKHMNSQLNEFAYIHGNRSTIVVYLVHFFFIELIQSTICVPLNLGYFAALALEIPLTLIFSLMFYVLIYKLPFIGLMFGVRLKSKQKNKHEANHTSVPQNSTS